MKTRLRRLLPWLLIMTLAASSLAYFLRPLSNATGFHVPSAGEAKAAEGLFRHFLAGDTQKVSAQAPEFKLGWSGFAEKAGQLHGLDQASDCNDGRGSYRAYSGADRLPLAIIAPHRGSDRLTGEIAAALLAEQPIAATAWNSAPRYVREDCPFAGDVAREKTHYITAFSLAFAQLNPKGRIVQLHGFDAAKRESSAARSADIIVSNGTDIPGDAALSLADCLTIRFPQQQTMVYPIDTKELGALSNAQGKALRDIGFPGFVHLEMSARFRRLLAGQPEARARFAECLAADL